LTAIVLLPVPPLRLPIAMTLPIGPTLQRDCLLGPGLHPAALLRPARRRNRPVTGAADVLQTPDRTLSGQG
jgi:hypothetical protein